MNGQLIPFPTTDGDALLAKRRAVIADTAMKRIALKVDPIRDGMCRYCDAPTGTGHVPGCAWVSARVYCEVPT